MSKAHVLFDIETTVDYAAICRAHKLHETDIEGAKRILGENFPKPPFHKIVAISAATLAYDIDERYWRTIEMASLHVGDRSEADLIRAFIELVRCTMPVLVSFNGSGFDLPVIKARAMMHRLSGKTLASRHYERRYSDMHLDLCDQLGPGGRDKMKLDQACRAMCAGAKLEGMDGAGVGNYIEAGRYEDVAFYCAADIVATAAIFFVLESYAGRLNEETTSRSVESLRQAMLRMQEERPSTFVQAGV